MNHSLKACPVLICLVALGASPVFAQTWDPVKSDSMNNTAMGTGALANPDLDEDGGCHNTASGTDTLTKDTSGSYNSATGYGSLTSNLTGDNNTGLGAETLYSNTSGSNNTATGYQTLYYNKTGFDNTAIGSSALTDNSGGEGNTAVGMNALTRNTSGYRNIAIGLSALSTNTTGSNDIAVGYGAGNNVTTGSENIDIASAGVAGDNGIIRIGTQGTQTATYIAGIESKVVTGAAVYVTSSGQLGVLASSERFKTDITPLGASTEKLQQLRPVSFKLKNDASGTVQYGLIAEEVAKVYPELVIHGADGQINGVRYEELTPMLLNEVQQQHEQLAAQASHLAAQDAKLAEMEQLLATLKSQAGDNRVAMR